MSNEIPVRLDSGNESLADPGNSGLKFAAGQVLLLAIGVWFVTVKMTLAGQPASAAETIELAVGQSWSIEHATHHVQGLCVGAEWFWISSVDKSGKTGWLYRVDRATLRVVEEQPLTRDQQFHPGGMQLREGCLWVPLAEYRPRSTARVVSVDPHSLRERRGFDVLDHLGAAASDDQGRIYAANWDARQVYVLSPQGEVLRREESRTGVAYQDWEWHDGALFAAGQTAIAGTKTAVVDVLDGGDFTLRRRYLLRGQVRSGGTNFSREGLSVFEGKFYLLPEDGPHSTVYEFTPPQ